MIQTTMETILFICTQVKNKLHELMEGHDVGGHGFDNFIAVGDHAVKALEYEDLSDYIKLQIELAAYLHDVDDQKIFPNSINYQNARKILNEIFADINFAETFEEITIKSNNIIDGIIQMIEIVSCSKNGDSEPSERWMAIPRDCDRLEAIGKIGIQRCYEYTLHTEAALHNVDTPKVYSEEELW